MACLVLWFSFGHHLFELARIVVSFKCQIQFCFCCNTKGMREQLGDQFLLQISEWLLSRYQRCLLNKMPRCLCATESPFALWTGRLKKIKLSKHICLPFSMRIISIPDLQPFLFVQLDQSVRVGPVEKQTFEGRTLASCWIRLSHSPLVQAHPFGMSCYCHQDSEAFGDLEVCVLGMLQ